ncbi:MAG: cytochrome c [Acidimicrobiia bacterium]|nr:cytochrome c [Acidimicrobiia bacterium]
MTRSPARARPWLAAPLLVVSALAATVAAQGTPPSQQDGVYTAAQAKRGEALYATNCAPCHNWDLKGNEIGPALAGTAFTARWNGRTLGDLFIFTQALMPQHSPGGLAPSQTADILAYMLQVDGAPAGRAELPARRDNPTRLQYTLR